MPNPSVINIKFLAFHVESILPSFESIFNTVYELLSLSYLNSRKLLDKGNFSTSIHVARQVNILNNSSPKSMFFIIYVYRRKPKMNRSGNIYLKIIFSFITRDLTINKTALLINRTLYCEPQNHRLSRCKFAFSYCQNLMRT